MMERCGTHTLLHFCESYTLPLVSFCFKWGAVCGTLSPVSCHFKWGHNESHTLPPVPFLFEWRQREFHMLPISFWLLPIIGGAFPLVASTNGDGMKCTFRLCFCSFTPPLTGGFLPHSINNWGQLETHVLPPFHFILSPLNEGGVFYFVLSSVNSFKSYVNLINITNMSLISN